MMLNNELATSFKTYFNSQVKRVLTQLDRDKDSPTYGCYDRNYWHYKIRDFPSSILQQGVFVTEYLSVHSHDTNYISENTAVEWSVAGINALSRQVSGGGGVDEYYPFEDSYPASAFSLYAVMVVLLEWKQSKPNLLQRIEWSGLIRLAKNLANRTEINATNQYATGLAGLAIATKIPEMGLCEKIYLKHAHRVFSLQDQEGWFNEYGGPDFGYLSVTIDALTDYYDVTHDERAKNAIKSSISFMVKMVGVDGQLPWTLNSRNTDYVVPYGLARAAQFSSDASWLINKLFKNINDPVHWIWSTDDRYHLHYIFSSFTRAIPYIKNMVDSVTPLRNQFYWLANCGYYVINEEDKTYFIGAKKGGLVRVHAKNDSVKNYLDNGWRFESKQGLWTTNWWQNDLHIAVEDNTVRISGRMVKAKFYKPNPLYNVALRMLSFTFGKHIIPLLKKIMIFRVGSNQSPKFKREINVKESLLMITDEFYSKNELIGYLSPRQNLRHVASADSFSPEDGFDFADAYQKHKIRPQIKFLITKQLKT